MDKYYYFVSQLPALQFGKETPISVEKFLNEASQWLTANDFKLLLKANEIKMPVEKVENRVLQQYFEFDAQVRSDIAHWRYAQRREEDFKPSTLSASFMKEGNPLEIEIRIMEKYWNFIDEMERDHHFDITFIIIYFIKLKLLFRLFVFNKETGLQKFGKFCEVAL